MNSKRKANKKNDIVIEGKMNVKEELSIAAVVYHQDEYLLLKYGLGHWEFVKGHKEENESDQQTILRELEEETGITNAEIIRGFKEKYNYTFNFRGQRIHKNVLCYLIKSNTKVVKISYEHEDFIWLPIYEALNKVTFYNARILLRKADKFLKGY